MRRLHLDSVKNRQRDPRQPHPLNNWTDVQRGQAETATAGTDLERAGKFWPQFWGILVLSLSAGVFIGLCIIAIKDAMERAGF